MNEYNYPPYYRRLHYGSKKNLGLMTKVLGLDATWLATSFSRSGVRVFHVYPTRQLRRDQTAKSHCRRSPRTHEGYCTAVRSL